MNKQWDLASKKCRQFQKFDITVPYKTGEQTFEMHARPLWDWARDLIQDPSLLRREPTNMTAIILSIFSIELEMQTDLAFYNFQVRFSTFLSNFVQVYGDGLPDRKLVGFTPDDKVIPFCFLKVFFQSLDNWEDDSDYLHCSPMFYGYP
ncbi:hypothetical protein C8J57DRAFT_1247610 [Mycena rebaudengoi]|nr:hypothetical protein C8J57DRAFT_1247610 [Mycena rebaudengoi]